MCLSIHHCGPRLRIVQFTMKFLALLLLALVLLAGAWPARATRWAQPGPFGMVEAAEDGEGGAAWKGPPCLEGWGWPGALCLLLGLTQGGCQLSCPLPCRLEVPCLPLVQTSSRA